MRGNDTATAKLLPGFLKPGIFAEKVATKIVGGRVLGLLAGVDEGGLIGEDAQRKTGFLEAR